MSTEARAELAADKDAPETPQEVVEWPLERGDLAVHVEKPSWYFVIGICDAPAGQIPATHGGTLDEWLECDPADEIAMVVTVERMKQSVVRVDHPNDIGRAVANGTVTPAGVPTKRLGIALEEFLEAEHAGEWSGLRDYLRSQQQEVSD
jgi:hypothetical protein